MALANRIAPEHLVVEREDLTRRPITAGAVFVGPFTAQAAGTTRPDRITSCRPQALRDSAED